MTPLAVPKTLTTDTDYLLILPWNLKDEIVNQMRHVGDWGCRFIVPIPEVHIIDPIAGAS